MKPSSCDWWEMDHTQGVSSGIATALQCLLVPRGCWLKLSVALWPLPIVCSDRVCMWLVLEMFLSVSILYALYQVLVLARQSGYWIMSYLLCFSQTRADKCLDTRTASCPHIILGFVGQSRHCNYSTAVLGRFVFDFFQRPSNLLLWISQWNE